MPNALRTAAADLAGVPVDSVELRETHISRVALAGEPGAGVALKQCKPVDFGFVNLSTPAARRAALETERAVNDRFAPGVYRGVTDLPDGEPALPMRRLDEADTLEARARVGTLTGADLDAVLDHILPLLAASDRRPEWGDPAVIRRNLVENLDVIDAALGDPLGERHDACELRPDQLGFVALREAELTARADGGFVRDGHGDLRCEHVYLTGDGVKVLDAIAWSDRLRCVDVADEVCFLAFDLDRLRAGVPVGVPVPDGEDLLDRYRARTGDPVSDDLLLFYRSYRAAVRCKVHVLTTESAGLAVDPEELDRSVVTGPLRYAAEIGLPDVLVAVGGLSGSGKSTLAAAVAARIGGAHLRSDVIRKELVGVPRDRPAPPAAYAPETTEEVYDRLIDQAAGTAEVAGAAVADATFHDPVRRRQLAEELSARARLVCLFVWCECDDAVADGRLATRAAAGTDASDADAAVRRRQAVGLERPTAAEFADVPKARLLTLNTDAPVGELCDRVIDALRVAAGFRRE